MESLSDSVTKIDRLLQSARQRLDTLNTSSKKTVATEVANIRSSLQDSSVKIQHATSQMKSYLSWLENMAKPETTVDVAPQIS